MTNSICNLEHSNNKLWRTHASVLKANYPVVEKIEKTANTFVKKYTIEFHEVMEDRMITNISADGNSCDVQIYSQALGSFVGDLGNKLYTITREQFEYLKEIWE